MQAGPAPAINAEAPTAAPPVALYIHVPFCVSICPYCDFVVVAGGSARGPSNRIAAFMEALRRELELRADALDAAWGAPGRGAPGAATGRGAAGAATRPPLRSLYFGGGTPSLLPAEELAALIEFVHRRFGLAIDAEITLEANPGPDERGDARRLAEAGITRISYGAQALDRGTLAQLGRRHDSADVGAAVADARAAGIRSVNIDLLYDVPGGRVAGWMRTLEDALELQPDHLSLYALTLDDPDAEGLTGPGGDHLPVSRGARRWRAAARAEQDEDRAAAMYHHAINRLAQAGYRGYEISNWARPGHESIHNQAYWNRQPYEAAGPGAHAFDGATRRWTAARLDAYIDALVPRDGSPGQIPAGGEEAIDLPTTRLERTILGLRTDRGLPLNASREKPLVDHFGWAILAELVEVTADERIVLTTRGRLLSNELFARLL